MDYMVCKKQKENIKFLILLCAFCLFLGSCAPDPRPPLWIQSLETLPQVEGFNRAGVFIINKKLYVQLCDPEGNQIWMRYNEEIHAWRQSKYNSLGCVRGENSTGPE